MAARSKSCAPAAPAYILESAAIQSTTFGGEGPCVYDEQYSPSVLRFNPYRGAPPSGCSPGSRELQPRPSQGAHPGICSMITPRQEDALPGLAISLPALHARLEGFLRFRIIWNRFSACRASDGNFTTKASWYGADRRRGRICHCIFARFGPKRKAECTSVAGTQIRTVWLRWSALLVGSRGRWKSRAARACPLLPWWLGYFRGVTSRKWAPWPALIFADC